VRTFRILHYAVLTTLSCLLWMGILPSFAAEGETTTDPEEIQETSKAKKGTEQEMPGLYNDMALLASEDQVYTASKRIEALRTAPTAVSVITSDHLLSLGQRYIPQILRLFPGIDVIQITRTEFTLSVRGFAHRSNYFPKDVLVLVDGRTVYDDYSGGVAWGTLDIFPQDVARIEVVRGAGSTIYGANAARGVINIITKPPQALSFIEADTGFGEKNGFRQRVATAGSAGRYAWKLTGGYDQADLWNRFDGFSLPDARGDQTWRFNTLLSRELTGGAELRIGAGSNFGRILQHTSSAVLLDQHQSTSHVQLEYEHPSLSVRAFWNGRDLESFDPITGEFDSRRTQNLYDLEMVHRILRLGRNDLSWGGDVRYTMVRADSVNGKAGEFTAGLFVDEQYNLTRDFLIRVAGRLDYHELAGYHFSPRAGVAYQVLPGQTVKASVSVGFRTPTLAENFFDHTIGGPIPFHLTGNKDLSPEKSIWYEAGYVGQFDRNLTLGLDFFHVVTDNLIHSTFVPPSTDTFINGDTVIRGRGVELWGEYLLTSSLRLMANYTYTHYQEGSEDIDSTPPNKINLGILFNRLKRFTGAITFHYQDRTAWPFADDGSLVKLGAYSTVDAFLGYALTDSWSARVEVYNATNWIHRELPVDGEEIPREVDVLLSYRM
jgi:iron complex outermembrane receptor protein